MAQPEGMLTGNMASAKEGTNAEQIPVCRGTRDEQGNLATECKYSGSDEWVIVPEDELGLFVPQSNF